jgi:hypothetical protein
MSTMFSQQFDCVLFLFDQSAGPTKMRINGLHMRNMNVSHGGSAGMMHLMILHEVGPHPRILHVGDNQVMHSVVGDNYYLAGPFGMTLAQQAETKHDHELGTAKTRRMKTKMELLKAL